MISSLELITAPFTGTFQRDPAVVAESLEDLEALKQEGLVEAYEFRKESHNVTNGLYDFEVTFLTVAPDGRFNAKGLDWWGVSALVGHTRVGKISFKKFYFGESDLPVDMNPFGEIDYKGTVSKSGEIITMAGTYEPLGIGNFKGDWRLKSGQMASTSPERGNDAARREYETTTINTLMSVYCDVLNRPRR